VLAAKLNMTRLIHRRLFCLSGAALLLPRALRAQLDPQAAAATRPAPSPAELATIRGHADGLLARAVRSVFGWGWAEDEPGVDLTRGRVPKGKPHPIDAVLTARIGLLLDLAAELTDDAAYRAAAVEAGRGVAALQTRAGQIRGKGVMGVLTAARDDAADVPDRYPTRAALGLLLHLIEGRERPDVRLKGPAQRAAHWLGAQQTHLGGWPSIYPTDAPRGQGTKLLRLDTPDLRDTLLAVLLASDVLGDRQLEGYFERGTDHLIAIRLVAGRPVARALWGPAYTLEGGPNTRAEDLPGVPDLLATRHAIEVLLAGYLVTLGAKYATALKEARDAIAGLDRLPNGGWHRRYNAALKPMAAPAATQPGSVFAPPPPPVALRPTRTAEVLALLDRAQKIAGKLLRDEIDAVQPLRRRLELLLAGFSDDALLIDPGAAKVGRTPELAGTGGLGETVDALWHELRTAVGP
jgi:hypothetical protein